MEFPKKLAKRLEERADRDALRRLPGPVSGVDFSSNDYLGLSKMPVVAEEAARILRKSTPVGNGATGSRLLTGNHLLYAGTEAVLAGFHRAEAALVFNSGYDANIGFFSSVPQRGDMVFYDEWIHASIRDGMQMGLADTYKFRHNDMADLEDKIARVIDRCATKNLGGHCYIVTESVFSMDGDSPDLEAIAGLAEKYEAYLVVDEAHAVGVFGDQGEGLVQEKGLQDRVFARIVTFGKAMGCHGAAVLGAQSLKDYLVNFARSFMYTTAMPMHSLAVIQAAYSRLADAWPGQELRRNISFFKTVVEELGLTSTFVDSDSSIHCCIVPGNERVKKTALKLQEQGFEVKAILSPTVPAGQERLRFCLHSYNTEKEISEVLKLLANFVL